MDSIEIIQNFREYLAENGDQAYSQISSFMETQRAIFNEEHMYDSETQARQGWVSIVGRCLENIVLIMLEDYCVNRGFSITSDKQLTRPETEELDRVRRNLEIHFGEYSLLPDGDIVVFCPVDYKVIAILSVKNSFRERYTETPYWKLKLLESPVTKGIKVYMITPDNDDEISYINKSRGVPRKARIVMEYDLDGIYLAKEEFDASYKVKHISELISDLEISFREHKCN